MKKLLTALLLALTISATCFAEGASGRFGAEEKAADALIAALTGNSLTYDEVSKSFSQGLKTNLTAENFGKLKGDIRKQVGTIKNVNFVILNKQYDLQKGYNDIDELVYFGTAGKEKYARIFISFAMENNVPKVNAFQITPIEPKKPETPAKK